MQGDVVVGTSSWADPGFVEEWYPDGLASRDRLAFYAERFRGVEVNSSWYALPSQPTVARWAGQTPEHFTFDVKLHRLLTRHAAGLDSLPRDLRERVDVGSRGRVVLTEALQDELVDRLLDALAPLREAGRLACLLCQLTPAFAPGEHDLDELASLVQACAPHPVAVELRHRAWFEGERRATALAWMREHRAALVGTDGPTGTAPTLVPAVDAATHPDVAYLRAHGRDAHAFLHGRTVAERFAYDYADEELRELVGRARALAGQVPSVRLQFNNNRGSDAPRAARRTRELLGEDPGPPPPRAPPARARADAGEQLGLLDGARA